jgi:uncharacterized membrane protein YgaE (UPF0421/DUF939 family)
MVSGRIKCFTLTQGTPTVRLAVWLVIQSVIIFLVVASNIHWQWTPNKYVPVVIGVFIAAVVSGVATVHGKREFRH